MNKAENISLAFGLLLWVVGDTITTYIGLSVGLYEANPISKNLFEIFFLKLGVVAFALIAIRLCENYNLNKYKIPIYTAFIFVGALAVINNVIQISTVI